MAYPVEVQRLRDGVLRAWPVLPPATALLLSDHGRAAPGR